MTNKDTIEWLMVVKDKFIPKDDDWYDEKYREAIDEAIKALEQKPTEKCTWIKYDYRTMCPKEHDVDNPYWRIPENRMETLKYCPYCGKEIEVEG